jgi:tRNA 2-thiouridine synthesizing protein A
MDARVLDCIGLKCPLPIVKAKKELDSMRAGELLEVHATDPGSVADFQGWARTSRIASLREQRTEPSAEGGEIYIHLLERKA